MILAIDPGLATGVAWLTTDGVFRSHIIGGGFDGMSDWMRGLREPYVPQGTDAIAIENFIPRGGALSFQPDAMHIIGMVKHIARKNNVPLLIQTPAAAKSFATNEKLQKAGWFNKGTEGHDNDAARHLLVAVVGGKLAAYSELRQGVLDRLVA